MTPTRGTRLLDALVAGTSTPAPVHETLRLGRLDEWGQNWVRKVWTPSPELLFADGSMFGGYIAALADQIQAFATYTVLPDGFYFTTISLQTQMLGQGRGQRLIVEGRVVNAGRQIVATECDLRRQNDGRLVATATAQQMLVPMSRKEVAP